MNKNVIKNFAIWARVTLIEAVKQKAYEYGITEKSVPDSTEKIGDRLLSSREKAQLDELLIRIKNKGYPQVMEEVAYTWFNRFIALRYMEVNGYLPSRVRVFTDENGAFKPEILKEAMTVEIEGLKRETVLGFLESQDNENLYKYLLITQCNALNKGLPGMFERIGGFTELLFPNGLLRADSVIGRMISDIAEEDWTDEVQIIGWLYQYYNSELKDETFELLKKNVKITKERIPAATQLFTPDWIVRYMVENSLGRLWYEGHDNFDKSVWKYYLDEAEQEESVQAQLDEIRKEYRNIQPENIKFIDPCMGSGHVLVYAFEVFMQIYMDMGWSERDAAVSILENNLYGLDIDKRAYQLAYFSLMMKARKYNRRILSSEIKPNLSHFQDMSDVNTEFLDEPMRAFAEQFRNADIVGSLLEVNVPKGLDRAVESFSGVIGFDADMLEHMVQIGRILSQKYDVVVTNPPYMGGSGMDSKLSEFVKKKYPDSKADMFAVFIERCRSLSRYYYAMITQHAFMFLSSFENLRKKLLTNMTVNMVHLGARAFDEIGGEVVQTTAFVNNVNRVANSNGMYVRLVDIAGENQKKDKFLSGENRYSAKQENFSKIPGAPVAYWVSEKFASIFKEKSLIEYVFYVSKGIVTTDNERFLRLWHEVSISDIENDTWHKYSKGGTFRRWYGNSEHLVLWKNNGFTLKNYPKALMSPSQYYNYEHFVWSGITTYKPSFRFDEINIYFDDVAPAVLFKDNEYLFYISGLCNSVVVHNILSIINPTIHFLAKDIKAIPIIIDKNQKIEVDDLVKENISLSKEEWNSFETSWDFKRHPLI